MRTILAFIIGAVALAAFAAPVTAESWKKHVNARFGTFAEYPADRFRPLPPPANGDGQIFAGRDGSLLTVSGGYNIENFTPSSYERFLRGANERDYGDVTYRTAGAHSLVLCGLLGREIFYEAYLFDGDMTHSLVITYPRAAKADYDPIVPRNARPFGPRRTAP